MFSFSLRSVYLIFILSMPLFSEVSFEVQKLENLSIINSLNSDNKEGKWYLSEHSGYVPVSVESISGAGDWSAHPIPSAYFKKNTELKTIRLLKIFSVPFSDQEKPLSFRLGTISDRDRTYLNGVLIGNTGTFGSDIPQAYDRIRIYDIPKGVLKYGMDNVLVIEVEGYFRDELGLDQDRTEIGPSQKIHSAILHEEYLKLLILAVYFSASMYFLFLFIRRRKETENFYFSVFTVILVIYQFMRNQLKYEFGTDLIVLKRIEYTLLYLLMPALSNFIRRYFHFQWRKVFKLLDITVISLAVYASFCNDINFLNDLFSNFVQPLWLFYSGFIVYFLIKKIKENERDAFILFGVFSVLLVSITVDSLSSRSIIVFPRITGYIFIFFILGITVILANRFVRVSQEVEDLNAGLEEKVALRTAEVLSKMETITKLKEQQDGDYFLTTLLLEPLNLIEVSSSVLEVESFISQKKHFVFRGWEKQLGGDINFCMQIHLQDELYTLAVNADAMGKSMQGAGGILVFGAVLRAVIDRTKVSPELKRQTPEIWLKNLFDEIHRLFLSFDGSMLVSYFVFLIHERTGFALYNGAEHPEAVLFRDGTAQFLPVRSFSRKLGSQLNVNELCFEQFQFCTGDTVILGSDGRDDVQMKNENGEYFINMDENLFLESVIRGRGSLEEIHKLILENGTQTDDISLLKISFMTVRKEEENLGRILEGEFLKELDLPKDSRNNDFPEKLKIHLENFGNTVSLKKILVKRLFSEKLYREAAFFAEEVFYENPGDNGILFITAYSFYKLGNYEKALEYAFRLHYRHVRKDENTNLICRIFQGMGDSERLNRFIQVLIENKIYYNDKFIINEKIHNEGFFD